jgi:hypothetical protein
LCNVHFSVVHEVEHGREVFVVDALEINERILMGIASENLPEEWAAGGQDDLVRLDLLVAVVATEGDVKKLLLGAEVDKGRADVRLKVVPPENDKTRIDDIAGTSYDSVFFTLGKSCRTPWWLTAARGDGDSGRSRRRCSERRFGRDFECSVR